MLKKGDIAPDFELRDQTGEKIKLSDVKGKVLLSFHPLAFTSTCTDQMRGLDTHYEQLKERDITAFGISVDAYPSKDVWARSIGLKNTKILADFNPKGEVSKAYGVYVDKAGISLRASILLENGKVLWSKEYIKEKGEKPNVEEILKVVDEM